MFTQDGTVVGLTDASLQGAAGIGYAVAVTTAGPELAGWQANPSPLAASNCANPLGPSSAGPALNATSGQSSDAAGIAQTLGTYYDSIDIGDYAIAYAQYAPSTQASMSEASFASQTASSYDFAATLNSVVAQPPGTDMAWVTFTSLQNASQGPTATHATAGRWTTRCNRSTEPG